MNLKRRLILINLLSVYLTAAKIVVTRLLSGLEGAKIARDGVPISLSFSRNVWLNHMMSIPVLVLGE
jgi:hypothetical protein